MCIYPYPMLGFPKEFQESRTRYRRSLASASSGTLVSSNKRGSAPLVREQYSDFRCISFRDSCFGCVHLSFLNESVAVAFIKNMFGQNGKFYILSCRVPSQTDVLGSQLFGSNTLNEKFYHAEFLRKRMITVKPWKFLHTASFSVLEIKSK